MPNQKNPLVFKSIDVIDIVELINEILGNRTELKKQLSREKRAIQCVFETQTIPDNYFYH